MGCCLFASILAGAPRLAGIMWWLFQPARFTAPFKSWPVGSWLWATAGILLLPWTTLMYVIVYPGGLSLVNWLFMGLAVAIDIASYAGGGKSYTSR